MVVSNDKKQTHTLNKSKPLIHVRHTFILETIPKMKASICPLFDQFILSLNTWYSTREKKEQRHVGTALTLALLCITCVVTILALTSLIGCTCFLSLGVFFGSQNNETREWINGDVSLRIRLYVCDWNPVSEGQSYDPRMLITSNINYQSPHCIIEAIRIRNYFLTTLKLNSEKTLKSDKGHQKVKESILAAITRWWLSHPFEQKIIKFIRSLPSFEVAIGELFQLDPPPSDHVFQIFQSLFLQR